MEEGRFMFILMTLKGVKEGDKKGKVGDDANKKDRRGRKKKNKKEDDNNDKS